MEYNLQLEEVKESASLSYSSIASDLQLQLVELLHEAAYGEVSPLGSSRFASSASKINLDGVVEYRNRHFVSGNLVVTSNGISQDKLKGLLALHGDLLPIGPPTPLPPSPYVGGDVRVRKDLDGSTNLGIAFPVPPGDGGKPFLLLAELLAYNFRKQKKCLSCKVLNYSSGGLLVITSSGKVQEATRVLEEVIGEIILIASSSSASVNGLGAAKARLALSKLSSVDNILSDLTSADLRAVADSSVTKAARDVVKSVPSYAVLGTTAGTPSYAHIRSLLA